VEGGVLHFSSLCCCFHSCVKKVLEISLQFELLECLAEKKKSLYYASLGQVVQKWCENVLCVSVR
jgi:hypothetical protein